MDGVNSNPQEAIKWQEMDRSPGDALRNGFRADINSTHSLAQYLDLSDEVKAEKISTILTSMELGKFDLKGCLSTVDLWQNIVDCQFEEFRHLKGVFCRLIKNVSRSILSGKWLNIPVATKEVLKNNITTIASTLDRQQMCDEEKHCRVMCDLIETTIWKEDYLNKVLKERLDIVNVDRLWEVEGWILIESRIEVLCGLANLVPVAQLAEACVFKGGLLFPDLEQEIAGDSVISYNMSVEKLYQVSAVFAVALARLHRADDVSFSRLEPYLTPRLAKETALRLCDNGSPHRLLPTWKHWKGDLMVALIVIKQRLEMANRVDTSSEDVRSLFAIYLKLNYLINLEDTTNERDIEKLTRELSLLSSSPDSEPALDALLEVSLARENAKILIEELVTAEHIYGCADAIMDTFGRTKLTLCKVVDMYMQELARQCSTLYTIRINGDKEQIDSFSANLAAGFESLAKHFEYVPQICFEILLTSFSLNPSQEILDRIVEMVECPTGPQVDVKLKISPSMNEMVELPREHFVDFMNVIQSARRARLTCFRDSWIKFKALCEKHLATRGDDIKTGDDLDLAKPTDFTLYVGMKPAYDDNDMGYEAGYCPDENEEWEEDSPVSQKKRKKVREPAFRMRMLVEDSKPSKKAKIGKPKNGTNTHVELLVQKLKNKPGPKPKPKLPIPTLSKASSRKAQDPGKITQCKSKKLSAKPTATKQIASRPKEVEDRVKRKYSTRKPKPITVPEPSSQSRGTRVLPRFKDLWPPKELFTAAKNNIIVLPCFHASFPSRGQNEEYSDNDRRLLDIPYLPSKTTSWIVQRYQHKLFTISETLGISSRCKSSVAVISNYPPTRDAFPGETISLFSQKSEVWDRFFGDESPIGISEREQMSDYPMVALESGPHQEPASVQQLEESTYSELQLQGLTLPADMEPPLLAPEASDALSTAVQVQTLELASESMMSTLDPYESGISTSQDTTPLIDPSLNISFDGMALSEFTGMLSTIEKDCFSELDDQDLMFSDFSDDEKELTVDGANSSEETEAFEVTVPCLSITDTKKLEVLSEITGEVVFIDDLDNVTVFLSESTGEFLQINPIGSLEEDLCPDELPPFEEFFDSPAFSPISDYQPMSAVYDHRPASASSSEGEYKQVDVYDEVEVDNDEPVQYLGTFSSKPTEYFTVKELRVTVKMLTPEEIDKYDRRPAPVPLPPQNPPVLPLEVTERRKSYPAVQIAVPPPAEKNSRCSSAETRRSSRKSRASAKVEIKEEAVNIKVIEDEPMIERVAPKVKVEEAVLPIPSTKRRSLKRSIESPIPSHSEKNHVNERERKNSRIKIKKTEELVHPETVEKVVGKRKRTDERERNNSRVQIEKTEEPVLPETEEKVVEKRKRVVEVELPVTKAASVKKVKTSRRIPPKRARIKKKSKRKTSRKAPVTNSNLPKLLQVKQEKPQLDPDPDSDVFSEDLEEEEDDSQDATEMEDDDPEFEPDYADDDEEVDNFVDVDSDDSEYNCEFEKRFEYLNSTEQDDVKLMEAYQNPEGMVWKKIVPDRAEPDLVEDISDSENDPLALDEVTPIVIDLISDSETEGEEELQPNEDPFPHASAYSYEQTNQQTFTNLLPSAAFGLPSAIMISYATGPGYNTVHQPQPEFFQSTNTHPAVIMEVVTKDSEFVIPDDTTEPVLLIPDDTVEPELPIPVDKIEPELPIPDDTTERELPIPVDTIEPELTIPDDTTEPELPIPVDTIEPELTIPDDTTEPELPIPDDTTESELLILDDTIEPELPIPDYTIEPELTIPDDTTESELLILDDTIEPELPIPDYTIEPELTIPDDKTEPELPIPDDTTESELPIPVDVSYPVIVIPDTANESESENMKRVEAEEPESLEPFSATETEFKPPDSIFDPSNHHQAISMSSETERNILTDNNEPDICDQDLSIETELNMLTDNHEPEIFDQDLSIETELNIPTVNKEPDIFDPDFSTETELNIVTVNNEPDIFDLNIVTVNNEPEVFDPDLSTETELNILTGNNEPVVFDQDFSTETEHNIVTLNNYPDVFDQDLSAETELNILTVNNDPDIFDLSIVTVNTEPDVFDPDLSTETELNILTVNNEPDNLDQELSTESELNIVTVNNEPDNFDQDLSAETELNILTGNNEPDNLNQDLSTETEFQEEPASVSVEGVETTDSEDSDSGPSSKKKKKFDDDKPPKLKDARKISKFAGLYIPLLMPVLVPYYRR